MLADNNLNTDEFIFTINYDGTYTQNYGGTTYLVHGPANIPAKITGCSGQLDGVALYTEVCQTCFLITAALPTTAHNFIPVGRTS